jgi:Transposase C of IS166 homeodomain
MEPQSNDIPDNLGTLKATLAVALAQNADDKAMIAAQKLEIAKLKRQIYGPRSERASSLIEQMELELDEAATAATEDDIAAERAATKTTTVAPFERKRPSRQPFPAHLCRDSNHCGRQHPGLTFRSSRAKLMTSCANPGPPSVAIAQNTLRVSKYDPSGYSCNFFAPASVLSNLAILPPTLRP